MCCCVLVACSQKASPPATENASTKAPEASALPAPAATEASRPKARNVVFITVDTIRADVSSVYGGPAVTPNLQKLADAGWTFDNAYSSTMLTTPSHVSLMTSLYLRDHGVYDNEHGVKDGVRTLATTLQREGFRTGATVGFKHLNPAVANLGKGFEMFIEADTVEGRPALETAQLALGLLDRLGTSEPFFIWVHFTDPHAPYEPPSDYVKRPRPPAAQTTPLRDIVAQLPKFIRVHPWYRKIFRTYHNGEEIAKLYYGEVEAVDAGIGVVLDGLEKRDCAAETAVIVVGDHGENLGEHGLWFHHGGLYDSTTHVPLIMRLPHSRHARLPGLVETVDIAPTILEAVGLPRWEPMRGTSLVGYVNGTQKPRSFVLSEHMEGWLVSVRSEAGTLILHKKDSNQFPNYPITTGRREIYDRRADPHELLEVGQDAPLVQELDNALDFHFGTGAGLRARQSSKSDKESLRALGYIE